MAATVRDVTALLQRSTVEDHEEIIKACNAVLKKSKHDRETLFIKVVALLKLDRFEDAVRVFEEGGDSLKSRAPVEWSYALYKIGRLDDAISAAAAAESAGWIRGAKHVEAQASYRAEKFQRTSEIYDELCGKGRGSDREEVDLRINMRATDAQLQWSKQKRSQDRKRPSREDLEGFESTYNVACEHIAKGQLHQAQLLLKRAKELCSSSEDLEPEDKVTELVPISVQQLYVALKQGKSDEAASLVEECSVDPISELSTKKIAQNNIALTDHENSNPYQQHKLFHTTPQATGSDRLFSFQNRLFDWNSRALDILVHKYDGVGKATSKFLSQHGSPTTSPEINNVSVINVAAHCKDEGGKTCINKALSLLEKRPDDIGLVLTIVQLYVENNNIASATSVLESLFKRLEESVSESDQDIRFSSGLISVLIALYKSQSRKRGIRVELSKAATHWQRRPDEAKPLLRAAGCSLLHSSNRSDLAKSGEIFSKLCEIDASDPIASAGYVASYATLKSPTQIQSEAEKLSSVEDLVSGVDIAALEQAGVPFPATATNTIASGVAAGRKRAAVDEAKQTARKKRFRKSRLPKDYDPNKQPDPERWLPLRDRSTYRPPKGKKGKQKPAERMQGGIVSEETGSTQPATAAPQQRAQGGGSSKKKKGKGKK